MKVRNLEVFQIHAEYCRALASPKRLAIMACLDQRELSVGQLAECLDSPLSTISRHLAVMKSKHLVKSRQEGTKVYYSPADDRIVEACTLIRTVLIDIMKSRGELAKEIDPNDFLVED